MLRIAGIGIGTKAAYLNEFSQAWQKGGEVK